MRKRFLGIAVGIVVGVVVVGTATAYIEGGWPETCLEMNDMVEASPLGSGAVGIYQRAFGDQAEAACQHDHREDVRRSFSWAFPEAFTASVQPETTPTSTSLGPAGQRRENPAPLGESVVTPDDWQVSVIGIAPNATAEILQHNRFNDPPDTGHQFFVARIRATYLGPGSSRFDAGFRLRAVGPEGVAYLTFRSSCGVIPDKYEDSETFSGGTREGNICWSIRSSDAGELVLYDGRYDDTRRRWWTSH
jgi:hypothetical protein